MFYVYILTNRTDKVMYVGVTNDIGRRINEHKSHEIDGFTKKYKVDKLVYFERYKDPTDAIKREKQLKAWVRIKKDKLVDSVNPMRRDLSEEL